MYSIWCFITKSLKYQLLMDNIKHLGYWCHDVGIFQKAKNWFVIITKTFLNKYYLSINLNFVLINGEVKLLERLLDPMESHMVHSPPCLLSFWIWYTFSMCLRKVWQLKIFGSNPLILTRVWNQGCMLRKARHGHSGSLLFPPVSYKWLNLQPAPCLSN